MLSASRKRLLSQKAGATFSPRYFLRHAAPGPFRALPGRLVSFCGGVINGADEFGDAADLLAIGRG